MRISDWSSDVFSSDLGLADRWTVTTDGRSYIFRLREAKWANGRKVTAEDVAEILRDYLAPASRHVLKDDFPEVDTIKAMTDAVIEIRLSVPQRSEEHTSELQSLMRNSYAVFCLQKKKHR